MSHYNTEYDNYYRSLSGDKNMPYTSGRIGNGNYAGEKKNKIGRRIIQEFTGTLILFAIVILCKIFVTPQTAAVYNYGKEIVNNSYNFTLIEEKLKEIKNDPSKLDIQLNIERWIKGVKDNPLDLDKIKNKFREKFSIQFEDSITYNENNEIELSLTQILEVYK
ncbi:hypothetical protein SH2C18_05980 [Clostridium sediminicola]|uniref:hypothetical protein n=1 Tax=Clostridium sediminicola TaxID=3114879 RepID=UPI0031F22EDD